MAAEYGVPWLTLAARAIPAPRHEPVAKNREPDAYSSGITTQRMT